MAKKRGLIPDIYKLGVPTRTGTPGRVVVLVAVQAALPADVHDAGWCKQVADNATSHGAHGCLSAAIHSPAAMEKSGKQE